MSRWEGVKYFFLLFFRTVRKGLIFVGLLNIWWIVGTPLHGKSVKIIISLVEYGNMGY